MNRRNFNRYVVAFLGLLGIKLPELVAAEPENPKGLPVIKFKPCNGRGKVSNRKELFEGIPWEERAPTQTIFYITFVRSRLAWVPYADKVGVSAHTSIWGEVEVTEWRWGPPGSHVNGAISSNTETKQIADVKNSFIW